MGQEILIDVSWGSVCVGGWGVGVGVGVFL